MMPAAVAIFELLVKHWDLIMLVVDAVEGKKVDKDALTRAVQAAMVEASDAEMKRELAG